MRDASNQSTVHRITGFNADSISLPLSHLQSSNSDGLMDVQRNVVHVSQSVQTHVEKVRILDSYAIREKLYRADACL